MSQENHFISPEILDRLLAISSAEAGFILRNEKVLMRAGDLSTDGFSTAESVLQNFSTSGALREFDQYVGFTKGQQYHLLFVKNFPPEDDLLGLVFSSQTPLMQIRQEMQLILKALMACKAMGAEEDQLVRHSLQSVLVPFPDPDPKPHSDLSQSGWEPEVQRPVSRDDQPVAAQTENFSTLDYEKPTVDPDKHTATFGAASQNNDEPMTSMDLEVMMDDIPWQAIDEHWLAEQDDNQAISRDKLDAEPANNGSPQIFEQNQTWQPLPEIPHEGEDLISMLQDDFEMESEILGGEEDYFLPRAFENADGEKISEPLLEDTQPISVEGDEKPALDSISDTTFYLVPRLNEHYILRDLSHELRAWMPEICEKYDWQLDTLLIRPDYIKWTLRDFPESQLSEMLTIVRLETSRRIIRRFPNLLEDNPTQDFWSPGYLVDTQNREFSTQALISRICESRADAWVNQ